MLYREKRIPGELLVCWFFVLSVDRVSVDILLFSVDRVSVDRVSVDVTIRGLTLD